MDMKRHLKSALKQLGLDKPRKAQIIPMNTLDAGQDAIVIAATGSGKQVIYETVGLAHYDKLTIVIEPLLALIYNQVQTLQEHDVSADYIDMTRSKEDIDKILNKARKGKLNFLYVTPERLQNHSFIETMQHSDIFMIVADECHCITEWGYTFRDAYLHIGDFINKLKHKPVICACSATISADSLNTIRMALFLSLLRLRLMSMRCITFWKKYTLAMLPAITRESTRNAARKSFIKKTKKQSPKVAKTIKSKLNQVHNFIYSDSCMVCDILEHQGQHETKTCKRCTVCAQKRRNSK